MTSCSFSRGQGARRPAANKAKNLRIDESILTGESVAASKHGLCPGVSGLGDQQSMAFGHAHLRPEPRAL